MLVCFCELFVIKTPLVRYKRILWRVQVGLHCAGILLLPLAVLLHLEGGGDRHGAFWAGVQWVGGGNAHVVSDASQNRL